MDVESSTWIDALNAVGGQRDEALSRLHGLLLRVALHEVHRRGPLFRIGGPELTDLAHQSADDAMIAILAKLDGFRGDSRFTTWAYRFVVLEVAGKLGRHFWLKPSVALEAEDWERMPDRLGPDPLAHAQQRDLITAIERAIDEDLTDHQRRFFIAVVLNGVPMEAVAARSGLARGAIYKIIFDARRKIRAHLIANGYLDGEPTPACSTDRQTGVEDRGGVALARSSAAH